jgi:hypothetical protein
MQGVDGNGAPPWRSGPGWGSDRFGPGEFAGIPNRAPAGGNGGGIMCDRQARAGSFRY